ncbi:hypothetical protein CEXT_362681 [Caerostris extrusa]|uniref:Uncharacterized protein n=1 Tax=Caerostris extrusa TaxID=172846 RepID=A0AAV4XED5_CAEEX|nr:hypothetical protein CEXT_362681 [Caerostris extrusa]
MIPTTSSATATLPIPIQTRPKAPPLDYIIKEAPTHETTNHPMTSFSGRSPHRGAVKAVGRAELKGEYYVSRRESSIPREPYLAENVTHRKRIAAISAAAFTSRTGMAFPFNHPCSANTLLKRQISHVLRSFNYTFRMDWYV